MTVYGIPITALIALLIAGIVLALVDRYNRDIDVAVRAFWHWSIYREPFKEARKMAKIDREIAEILNNPMLSWPVKGHTVINYMSLRIIEDDWS